MTRISVGVGLATLATLLLELLFTRIFSVTLYYHFAFMVISLALFGLGLSGVMLYLRPERFPEAELPRLLSQNSRRFAVCIVVSLAYVLNHSLTGTIDALAPGRFGWMHFFQLAFLYLFATLPFYFGGMVVSLALFHLRTRVATLYFFDLVGASLACLVLDPLLRALGAPDAVLVVALLAALCAVVFGREVNRLRPERSSVLLALGLALLLGLNLALPILDVGSFKFVDPRFLVFSRWNAMSRIEVQEQPLRPPALTIDSMAQTNLYSLKIPVFPPGEQDIVNALAYKLRPPSRVLIVGPGGGTDVVAAMTHGHRDLTLVEINPIILYDVMLGRYRAFSGDLYAQPGVKVHLDEGRSFIRRSGERYDIIQATLVDTWAATAAGTFALSENHLYTVEAFADYLEHLTPSGIVTMSRWVHIPGMEFVRLCALAREALERRGVKNPEDHVYAVHRGRVGNLLVKRTPFTREEIGQLNQLSQKNGLFVLYQPGGAQHNPAAIVLGTKDPRSFYRSFPIDVRPVFDERPFFFYAVKPERVLSALFSGELLAFNSFSLVVLAALLGLVSLLVLSGIIVPLWLGQRRALSGQVPSKLRDLAYFLCIGVGFILVEIALLHRFTLHLGHPIHSLRVVLFALLLASGVGSLLSGRVRSPRGIRRLQLVAGLGIVGLVGLYAVVLGPLMATSVGWSLPARAALAASLVALPGLLMGMMLPAAVRLLALRHESIIPWAWGLNGAASVFGSVLAMALALHLGFNMTLLVGAGAYCGAVLLALRKIPEEKIIP